MDIGSLLKKINRDELEEIQELTNRYQYQGMNVPRVTEILSTMIHEEYLMKWANNIGLYQRKKYQDERDKAAAKGTYVHDAIEDFIQNGIDLNLNGVTPIYRTEVSYAYGSFKSWWEIIAQRQTRVIMQEVKLICPWFGGTLDLLIEIDGKIYLLDFKTSNSTSYKYFLQLAAYRYILKNFYGIEIYGCGVIKLEKKYIGFEEYIIDKSNPEYEEFMNACERAFLSLVYAYISKCHTEYMYKNLF